MDGNSVWSIDQQDRPSFFVSLSDKFQILERSCLQVRPDLLDIHCRYGRPNLLGEVRIKKRNCIHV